MPDNRFNSLDTPQYQVEEDQAGRSTESGAQIPKGLITISGNPGEEEKLHPSKLTKPSLRLGTNRNSV
jgi:hypothetical protein